MPSTDGIVIRGRQAMSWVSEELKYVDLGDKRRNQRLVRIVEDLSSQPEQSVPQASRGRIDLHIQRQPSLVD